MAEDEGQKTEEPTEHKLQEARKKGQVFKSTEIISSIQFGIIALALAWAGAWGIRNLLFFTRNIYGIIPHLSFHSEDVWTLWMQVIGVMAKLLLPVFAAAFFAGLLLNLVQTGVVFSVQPLTPTLEKISPIEGFKRIFSRKSLVELFKQVFKITIIGWVAYKVIKSALVSFVNMVIWDFHHSVLFTKNLMFQIIWYVTAAYIAMAILDYVIQRKFFLMQMKMSIQELKDEFKDTEGDPQVKARMRQMQRQMVERSMMKEVPKASAVVTNPVHLAVALQYEQGKMDAPFVVAKGERLVAERIREVAEENHVPVIENVGLARALFEACKVGQTVPGELYKAVAEVLAFVYRLKHKQEIAKRRAILKVRNSRMSRKPKASAGGSR